MLIWIHNQKNVSTLPFLLARLFFVWESYYYFFVPYFPMNGNSVSCCCSSIVAAEYGMWTNEVVFRCKTDFRRGSKFWFRTNKK